MLGVLSAMLLAGATESPPATAPATATAEPKLIMDEAGFPHASVDAAMDALLDNRDAKITVRANWTSIEETVEGQPVHWTFTPENHPAHPSAIRRTPIEKDGDIWVKMSWRCEARPAACETLLQEFRKLNEAKIREFKRELGLLDHPRQAEALAFAERYLDLIEQGKDDETITMLTPYSRSGVTPGEWRRIMDETRSARGTQTLRKLRKLQILQNPPGVEPQGILAIMEFETMYDIGGYFLQYLVLHSDKDAPFRVMKDEVPHLRFGRIRKAQ